MAVCDVVKCIFCEFGDGTEDLLVGICSRCDKRDEFLFGLCVHVNAPFCTDYTTAGEVGNNIAETGASPSVGDDCPALMMAGHVPPI
nr:MAG TPA: hypothetical protein [Caudoviricetes sp.]